MYLDTEGFLGQPCIYPPLGFPFVGEQRKEWRAKEYGRGAGRLLSPSPSRILSLCRCFRAASQLTEHLEEAFLCNAWVLLVLDKSVHRRLFLCCDLFFFKRVSDASAAVKRAQKTVFPQGQSSGFVFSKPLW